MSIPHSNSVPALGAPLPPVPDALPMPNALPMHWLAGTSQSTQVPGPFLALNRRPPLDHLNIRHEPSVTLRRFLRVSEIDLQRRNMHLSLIDPLDLMTANDAHLSSWEPLIATLDARQNVIGADNMIVLGVFGPKGDLIGTGATRLMEIPTSLKAAFEDLTFFYGDNAPAKRASETFSLTAPSAATLCGRIAYRGGFWIRPDMRRNALPRILSRLARVAAMAAWNPDAHVGIATDLFLRPDISAAYSVARVEKGFTYTKNGHPYWDGVLTVTDRDEANRLLLSDIETYADIA